MSNLPIVELSFAPLTRMPLPWLSVSMQPFKPTGRLMDSSCESAAQMQNSNMLLKQAVPLVPHDSSYLFGQFRAMLP